MKHFIKEIEALAQSQKRIEQGGGCYEELTEAINVMRRLAFMCSVLDNDSDGMAEMVYQGMTTEDIIQDAYAYTQGS